MPEPEPTASTGMTTSSLVLSADDPADLTRFYGALLKVGWPRSRGWTAALPGASMPKPAGRTPTPPRGPVLAP